jgi:hypothetical protein
VISLTAYPENTLEGLIAHDWVRMITECEDHQINLEPISERISVARIFMCEQGWPKDYQHNYLAQLRRDLTELTHGHTVTRQFVTMLEIELEFN